jgi:nicotinamide-nucleotide amidase
MSTSSTPTPTATLSTQHLAEQLAKALLHKQWRMCTAESCTGGLIGGACTDLAGSSLWFDSGFITYSNDAKTALLGVDAALIARRGAVSEQVAAAMLQGALQHTGVQVGVAVTGIAGPTGGSRSKPVGTVWFAFDVPGRSITEKLVFAGDRAAVRAQTVQHALKRLTEMLT